MVRRIRKRLTRKRLTLLAKHEAQKSRKQYDVAYFFPPSLLIETDGSNCSSSNCMPMGLGVFHLPTPIKRVVNIAIKNEIQKLRLRSLASYSLRLALKNWVRDLRFCTIAWEERHIFLRKTDSDWQKFHTSPRSPLIS